MHREDFNNKYRQFVSVIDDALNALAAESDSPQKTVYDAMRYSLLAGGKRLRPVLMLAVCEMLGGKQEDVVPYACAIEMIHTYSLIHDDLPAIDNDDYRRGRLTNHKVYGEAIAILAGDGLLNLAFETMLTHAEHHGSDLKRHVQAMKVIANASGVSGMIGGQVVDIEAEGRDISSELLEYLHRHKTGALIKAPVIAAAILCGADEACIKSLESYAEKIGLAFQIKDDILDVEGSFESLGKSVRKDMQQEKSTFVKLYGLDGAKNKLYSITEEAVNQLAAFGEKAGFLSELAFFIAGRQN